jgi:hypothetical protein
LALVPEEPEELTVVDVETEMPVVAELVLF